MSATDSLIGRTLEHRYTLVERIGGGRVGGVYRCTDSRAERQVAVRVISAEGLDEDARARLRSSFRAEARAAVRLAHPHLVQALDYGSDERLGIHYLVTELHDPLHLGAWLREYGTPPVDRVLSLVLQAAQGLGAAHAGGLVHRGIRPGTLLLADTGDGRTTVRIADFARVDLEGGAPGSGAAPYRAPELDGRARCTAASDVYALAVTALQALTGRSPSSDPGSVALLVNAARGVPVPAPVLEVLATALSPDPRDRFLDARGFADALQAAATAAGITPTPPRLVPRRGGRPMTPRPAEDTPSRVPAEGTPASTAAGARARPVAIVASLALLVVGAAVAGILMMSPGGPADGEAGAVAGGVPAGEAADPADGARPVTGLVQEPAAGDRVLTPGQTVAGQLTSRDPRAERGGNYHLWRVEARPGEVLTVTMRSTDVDPYLIWGTLADGRWEERGSDDDGGEGRDARLRFTVPQGGTIGIHATTFGSGERGRYTLEVRAAPAPVPVTVPVGTTVRWQLAEGNTEDHDGAYAQLYRLSGEPGQRVVVEMSARDFDAFLRGGRIVDGIFVGEVHDDDGGTGTDARLVVQLDRAGAYAILATSYAPGSTGAFTLTVQPAD
jgi:eukaryotic-like serine/threonine-protein kinase